MCVRVYFPLRTFVLRFVFCPYYFLYLSCTVSNKHTLGTQHSLSWFRLLSSPLPNDVTVHAHLLIHFLVCRCVFHQRHIVFRCLSCTSLASFLFCFFPSRAVERKCINAQHPDSYGHYREAKYTQTKHHWWWKVRLRH